MSKNYFIRHKDIINPELQSDPIHIVGCGAVGSHVALALARMGYWNLHLYDFDQVDEENMSCQGYFIRHIGRMKVECLAEMIEEAVGFRPQSVNGKWEGKPLAGIVIMALDNMATRRKLYETCSSASLLIDPRMGAEIARLFVGKPSDLEKYLKSWYSDDNAVFENCTAKATIYCANLLSGLVVKVVKDFTTRNPYTKSVSWAIRENVMSAYSSNGERLN